MYDMCPRCRIQAPHRDGREHCPRCGGNLVVVESAQAAARVPRQSGPPTPTARPPTHPAGHPAPPAVPPVNRRAAPRPAPQQRPRQTQAPRMYRSRNVRWVARRPPESFPQRRPQVYRGPRLIPRYTYLPRWGLRDDPIDEHRLDAPAERASETLRSALVISAGALAASAVVHLLRYILLVINRGTPLPAWLIVVSGALAILGGLVALVAVISTLVATVRWLIAVREHAYRHRGRRDPRPRWQIIVLAGVPVVNVIGAPLLLHEAANAAADDWRERGVDGMTRAALDRLWVAWALVNALAIWAAITWAVSLASGSIQTGADALALITISAAVSAAFAFWASRHLPNVLVADEPVVKKRWVAVA